MTVGTLEDRIAKLEKPERNSEGKGGLAFVAAMIAALYAGYDPYLCIGAATLITALYMYIRYQLKLKGVNGNEYIP